MTPIQITVLVVMWVVTALCVAAVLHALRPVLRLRYLWARACCAYYERALRSLYAQNRQASDEAVEVFWLYDAALQQRSRLQDELRRL